MRRSKRSRATFLVAGLLALAAFAPAAMPAGLDSIATASVVVQAGGPRPGPAGKVYCNIQGKGTGDPKYAGFAILDFPAPRREARVRGLTLGLTQSVARFTRDGKVRFFLDPDADVGLEPLARPLRFDPSKPDGLGDQVPKLLPIGPGEFAKGATGDVDTYPLALDDAARKAIDEQVRRGGTIRIVAVPEDAHVAATYFGAGAKEIGRRPRITLDLSTGP